MVAAEEKALIPIDQRALAEFDVTPEAVAEKLKEFREYHVIPGDKKSYKQVHAARMVLVHLRNAVEKRSKKLGEDAREWIDAIGRAKKQLIEPIPAEEERLKSETDAEDVRETEAQAEKERIEKERVEGIRRKISEIQKRGVVSPATPAIELRELFLDTFEMEIEEEEFMEFRMEAVSNRNHVINVLKAAIATREAWEKEEADRKAEADRVAKEREAQEAEAKRLAEDRRKLEEEKARLEADKKAEAEAKAKAEREAKEAKEKEEREAQEKKNQEEADAKEKERKAAIAPDKEKLVEFADEMTKLMFVAPSLATEKAIIILEDAVRALNGVIAMIRKEAEKL